MPPSAWVSELTAGVAIFSTGGSPSSAASALGTSDWIAVIVGTAFRAVGSNTRSRVASRGATGPRSVRAGLR